MNAYKTKASKLAGTDFHEVRKKAFTLYQNIKGKSKRKTYIRSAYFNKSKIFLDIFWHHLFEKNNFRDFMRRIKLYPCAIEVIEKSTLEPTSKENVDRPSEILHRFTGITAQGDLFYVQVKEEKRSGKKWLISTFPHEKKTLR